MFCPRTQQQCWNPECGKTTGICDPSQPINYSTSVYTEEYVKQLQSTIDEKDKEIERLRALAISLWYPAGGYLERELSEFKTENNL